MIFFLLLVWKIWPDSGIWDYSPRIIYDPHFEAIWPAVVELF